MEQTDIQKLRALPIEGVAERLGLHVTRGRCLCPFHDDSRPSLMFPRGKNSYRCYVCDASGSGPIDLVMRMLNKSFIEACKWLADETNVIIEERKPVKKIPTQKFLQPVVDIRYLERLIATPVLNREAQKFLFDERRISPEVVARLGLSSISTPVPMSGDLNGGWFNAPSLLIPYRDVEGRLLSVQARYLGSKVECLKSEDASANTLDIKPSTLDKPRFQFPKGATCSIFNLQVLKEVEPNSEIFITEGVSDCLAMLSSGRNSIAIPSATLLKPQDAELLQSLSQSLTLHCCPDRDAPGERLFLDLKTIFPNIIRHQLPEGYKDFGQWWSLNGTVTKFFAEAQASKLGVPVTPLTSQTIQTFQTI